MDYGFLFAVGFYLNVTKLILLHATIIYTSIYDYHRLFRFGNSTRILCNYTAEDRHGMFSRKLSNKKIKKLNLI